jgi:hypothetical protein
MIRMIKLSCVIPFLLLMSAVGTALVTPPAFAQTTGSFGRPEEIPTGDLVSEGHRFFGTVSRDMALAIQEAVSRWGEPNGYILGEEGSGAFVGGLRYGEGKLFTRNAGDRRVYWQGPSLGWDFGGDGARTMILVYNMPTTDAMFTRFAGVAGSAYVVGGVGMTALMAEDMVLVPIKSGVGARLGVNVGYLKFTSHPTWNPF